MIHLLFLSIVQACCILIIFRLDKEMQVFKRYPTLDPALKYSSVRPGYRVFAFEKASQQRGRDSTRVFVAAERDPFLLRYYDIPDERKNFYEIITSGSPCRLYFDLEYQRAENPDLVEEDVIDVFVRIVCHCLNIEFNVNAEPEHVLDMVSSPMSAKMSHHLVYHLPNSVFQHNGVCGIFVKEVWSTLLSFLDHRLPSRFFPGPFTVEELKMVGVMHEGKRVFVADLCVYSKNRQFRLLLSRKWGKENFLATSLDNQYPMPSGPIQALEKSLVCCDVMPGETLLSGSHQGIPNVPVQPRSPAPCTSTRPVPHTPQHLRPLQDFVETVLHRVTPTSTLKVGKMDVDCVKFDIVQHGCGSRGDWCANVQRNHKHNRCYYIADLYHKIVYQRCYDPDCSGFKSVNTILPDNVNPSVSRM